MIIITTTNNNIHIIINSTINVIKQQLISMYCILIQINTHDDQ